MKVRVNFNNRLTTLAGAIAITLASGASANPPASSLSLLRNAPAVGAAVVKDGSTGKQLHLNVHADVARYTVILKEEPVATYDGLVSGYPKISRNVANGRLDVKSKEAVNYANYLRDRQNQFLSAAGTQLKRPLNAILQFQHAVNGVVVELTLAEASELAKRDDVLLVDAEKLQPLLTNRSTSFIGADKIWDGSATGGLATQGEGIVIGDIDSGINFTSPSFASPGPVDGYVYANPLGAGNYLGLCQPGGVDEGHCNAKLIGLYDFVYSICSAGNGCGTAGTWTEEASATDSNGHGSHTASTAAGNHANVTLSGGDFTISGVAPHASIVAYDVCYTRNSDGSGLCPTTSTTNAANQAVADGIVDILTFSIGGGTSPWTDSTSLAFLGAQNAGIFVVAAAGNDGPAASTVSHVEPWVATAAASTDDQVLGYTFNLTGPGTPPANTINLPARPGANPQPAGDLVNLPITQSPGFANGNNDGCSAFADPHTFDRDVTASERIFADGFEGTTPAPVYQKGIAVLHLDGNNSGCGSGARRGNALNAGAAGVIFVDTAYLNLGASDTSYSMTFDEWNPVYAQISTDPANATASVLLPLKSYLTAQGDVIADFSSRGPNAGLSGQAIVKPEVAAPGVAILAAYMGDPGAVALEDGTSMSTPHIAGSAALLRSLHPEWTPTQIRSAMMMTAKTDGVVKQDNTPAGIWERGAGRIDLPNAAKASLVFDETGANFTAANPSAGGKISTLNLPSIADSNCVGACTYSRTVKGVHAGAVTYTLNVDGFPAGSASVAPATMPVSTGGTKTFIVTVHGDMLTSGQYTLGQVTFTPSDPNVPVQHMPVAVKPGGPVIQVSANSVSASQDVNNGPVTQPLTITNIGNPTLNWSVGTGTAALSLMNTASTSNGELGGYYNKIPAGSYLAQNFDVTGPVRITKLTANGFVLPSGSLTTTNTPNITFKVYADNAGVPDGSPGDPPTANNGNAPIFTYTNTIGTANGITTTSGALNLDLTKATVPVLNLTAGRYWLVVAPNINSDTSNTTANPLWAWRVSSDPVIGNSAQIIGSLWSLTDWEDVEATPTMLSTIVSGTVDCTQPSWVSYAPTSDSLGYNASTAVTVTFNPTGLTPGNYAGNLCVSSNATNKATAVVALNFAVTGTLTHKVTPSVGTDPSWGTIAPDTQQTVNDGATTQFTLTPASGYHTDTVGGTCGGTLDSGTNVYTTNAVTADCTVIANFAVDVVTHKVTPSVGTDPSWGTINPDTQQTVNDGATTQFTLTPASGYHTDTVGGTCGGTLDSGTNVFTTAAVTADCSVIANFAVDVVLVAPTVAVSFSPSTVLAYDPSTLTITFSNSNAVAATLTADFVDNLPSGVAVATIPNIATTCGNANVAANSGDVSVTLSSAATIPANDSCTLTVDVLSAAAGTYTDTIAAGTLATDAGNDASGASADLTVSALGAVCTGQPLLDPSFEATDSGTGVNPDWSSTDSVAGTALCDSGCGSTARTGSWYVWFGGYNSGAYSGTVSQTVTIPAGFDRTLNFYLKQLSSTSTNPVMTVSIDGTTLATYPRITTSETAYTLRSLPIPSSFADGSSHTILFSYTKTGSTGSTGSGIIDDVTLDCSSGGSPAVSGVSFTPNNVDPNVPSTFTVSLSNANAVKATLTSPLTHEFLAGSGLVVAPTPNATTTCDSGIVTANAGEDTVTLNSGAQIPATGSCTFSVDVVSATGGIYTDTIPAGVLVTNLGGSNALAVSALIQVNGGTPALLTGFEPSPTETPGFATGNISGQNGWGLASGSANDWKVAGTNPKTGAQHLRATWTSNGSGSTQLISQSVTGGTAAYSVSSADIAVKPPGSGTTSTTPFYFIPQDPGAASIVTEVEFANGAGNKIYVAEASDSSFHDTGFTWTPGTGTGGSGYAHFDIVVDRSTLAMNVCMDGALIYSGTAFAGNATNVLFQSTKGAGTTNNLFDVDNLAIDYVNTPVSCPAPSAVQPVQSKSAVDGNVQRAAVWADRIDVRNIMH